MKLMLPAGERSETFNRGAQYPALLSIYLFSENLCTVCLCDERQVLGQQRVHCLKKIEGDLVFGNVSLRV